MLQIKKVITFPPKVMKNHLPFKFSETSPVSISVPVMEAVGGVPPDGVVSAVTIADGSVVTLTGPPINFNRLV